MRHSQQQSRCATPPPPKVAAAQPVPECRGGVAAYKKPPSPTKTHPQHKKQQCHGESPPHHATRAEPPPRTAAAAWPIPGWRAGRRGEPRRSPTQPPPAHEKPRDHDQPLPYHAKHLPPPRSHRRCRPVKPGVVAGGVRGQNAAQAQYLTPPGHIKTATAPRATATRGHTASTPAHSPSPQFREDRGGGRAGADNPRRGPTQPTPHHTKRHSGARARR